MLQLNWLMHPAELHAVVCAEEGLCASQLGEEAPRQQQQAAQSTDAPASLYYEEAGNEEEDRRKRNREAIERDSLEHFLKDLGREQEQASGGSGQHGETTRQHAQSDEKGKRSYSHAEQSTAAKNTKAGRERARRERLNERCASHERPLPFWSRLPCASCTASTAAN